MLNNQLLDKMYKEKAEVIFKCIPMKMEEFYEKFDRECMDIPIFKYYDCFQMFQRISCASNEDIVTIKEKLADRAKLYKKELAPELANIKKLKNIMDITLSLVGRNLWMIYCKAPFDPEAVASTDNFYQGIDNFMMPSLRNFVFNVNFNF